MKHRIREQILTLLVSLAGFYAGAQPAVQYPQVTVFFKQATLREFTDSLHKQTGYRFYFDNSQFDSIAINLTVNAQPLTRVLELAFANTPVKFSIDDHHHVFITKGLIVQTTLPQGFFAKEEPGKDTLGGKLVDYLESGLKSDTIALENKLFIIGERSQLKTKGPYIINGYIRDGSTGEPVVGATLIVEGEKSGVATDQFGYYSIAVKTGRHTINIQSVGMRDTKRQILVNSEGKLNIDMKSQVMTLKRVIISAEKASNIKSVQMGVQRLDIKTIKLVPVVFGESDILRVALTLPGVKTVGESSTGLNVRGGSVDQNLILFNDATVYNPSHFFGLFSAFNPEAVKDVELFKSSIPAKYGGRLSSVLEISSREGDKKKITGSAGVGLLTSRLNIEGPLVKDKTSFMLGGRTTYANWLLGLLPDQYKNSKASFYDLNLMISHEINKKNNLYFTGYLSADHFNLNNDTTYGYGNKNLSLKWKHVFNSKLFSVLSGGYDGYQYSISSGQSPPEAYKFSFNINQSYFKANFNYFSSRKHTFEFGLNTLLYQINPGTYQPEGKQSLAVLTQVQQEHALESALYLSDKYMLSDDLAIEAGIRYSVFNYMGPQSINNYPPGVPRTSQDIVGATTYGAGQIIKTYQGPEYRASARYIFSQDFSLKAGYNTQRQYVHLISNTAAMAPTDIWQLSGPYIRPEFGDQISLGLYRNFKSNTIETSVEVYYKDITGYLDYKSGAQLVLNPHLETDVINTKGQAYGVEFQVKRTAGKLNGWLSYSYSRTLLKQDDPLAGELINSGRWYPADYDIPHELTMVSNYQFSHRYIASLNATYSTGRPITLPIGKFFYAGSERTLYSDRNAYRIPDYFRMDFSFLIDGNHKLNQLFHNSWSIGVYNLTGRKNPFSVYYVSQNGVVTGYKLSIFGSAIPFVNYNVRF
ncbi:MAG TPA: carboxypeptidase-like regulatory domain-containing protein [Puia sp.]|nr:carboxypeptidase-like regulatory domain-containing protein [Puia sp.]